MTRLSLSLSRSTPGSTSAPARKVSTMLPNDARKVSQAGVGRCRTLPTTTPSAISTTAMETPSSTEIMLASSTTTDKAIATYCVVATNSPPEQQKGSPSTSAREPLALKGGSGGHTAGGSHHPRVRVPEPTVMVNPQRSQAGAYSGHVPAGVGGLRRLRWGQEGVGCRGQRCPPPQC